MQSPALQHHDRLLPEFAGWDSIQLQVEIVRSTASWWTSLSSTSIPVLSLDENYIETSKGERFYESRGKSANPKVIPREVNYCDGRLSYNLSFDFFRGRIDRPSLITIRSEFGYEGVCPLVSRPLPLQIYYVGKIPLHEALRDGQYGGIAHVGGRMADLFVFAGPKFGQLGYEYALDQKTSVPIRMIAYASDADRAEGRERIRWEAESIESVQGHPFPMKSNYMLKEPREGTGRLESAMTDRVQVVSLKYDQGFAASRFKPDIDHGIPVLDTVKGMMRQTAQKPIRPIDPSGAGSLQESPEGVWSLLPTASWILGIGALVLAIWFGWIRRR